MRKPCREGKTDSKTEASKISLLFFAVLLSSEIYSQIPINGFCRYNEYTVQNNLTKILALNFNSDSYTDLILFSNSGRNASSLIGEGGSILSEETAIQLPTEFSRIRAAANMNEKSGGYGFTSRKNKKAGIIKFRKNGIPYIEKEIVLKDFPENLIVSDIDFDGKPELIVSGSAFGGLLLLSNAGLAQFDTKYIEKKGVFSNAVLADLNNDGMPDVAAYNLLKNSLDFYYNKGRLAFDKVRSIPLPGKITSLQAFDINLDGLSDILFTHDNFINILYGDEVSSFKKSKRIETRNNPDKVIQGDFNRDGYMDIAYLNKLNGIFAVIFARNEELFHNELTYAAEKGLIDLVPFYSRFINGVALLSLNGKLKIISNTGPLTGDIDLVLSPQPEAINYFDSGNNGVYDITYIDRFTRTLNLVTRNNAGVPQKFYSYPLQAYFDKIEVDNSSPDYKIFYCFSYGSKLIEAVTADMKENRFNSDIIYAPGKIEDIKVKPGPGKNDGILYVAFRKNKSAGVAYYTFKDFRYVEKVYTAAEHYYLTGTLSPLPELNFYYWTYDEEFYTLFNFQLGKSISAPQRITKLPVKTEYNVRSFSGDLLGKEVNLHAAFFFGRKDSFAHIAGPGWSKKIEPGTLRKIIKLNSPLQLFFGETRFNGIKKLTAHDPESNVLYRFDFLKDGRSFITSALAEVPGLQSYFIKNMNSRGYHAVYTNSKKNTITVKEIY